MNTNSKIPFTYWIIGAIALLWNLMGLFAFYTDITIDESSLALMEEGQRSLYESMPSWTKFVYGVATIAGVLGSIGLLMRKKWSVNILLLSLICILIQFGYNFFGTEMIEIMGAEAMTLPVGVILIGLFLWYYAKKSEAKGILN